MGRPKKRRARSSGAGPRYIVHPDLPEFVPAEYGGSPLDRATAYAREQLGEAEPPGRLAWEAFWVAYGEEGKADILARLRQHHERF